MTGERCPHCQAVIAAPNRRVTQADAYRVHLESCPGLLRVKR